MPDRDLPKVYLERLQNALALSDDERRAAVEEIDSHVQLAADEMAARGIPRDAAVRQVLERLGTPERLAGDITSAHRRPLDLVTATGVALRVSIVSGFKAIVLAWVGMLLLVILLGLAVAGIRSLVGSQFLQADWSPVLDGLVPAALGAVVAYAVGRSLVAPIAIAAHRVRSEVRMPVLAVGTAVAAAIGLMGVEARWSIGTAIAMASLPAWFALGILRPNLVHARRLPNWWVAGALVVLVVGLPALLFAAGGRLQSGGSSTESEAYDPNVEYASVGRFVDLEHPPIELADGSTSPDAWIGPGPVTVSRSGTFVTGSMSDWTDLRLEVWPGPADELDGSGLDPAAKAPLATTPMETNGHRVSGEVEFWPDADRSSYYVAVTGLTADGERVQLAWPGIEHWQWRGTMLQFFQALAR